MCTVTFVPIKNGAIITSNRDEQVGRLKAFPPQRYRVGNKTIAFPKDPKGGGSWFSADETGSVMVLLNGASEAHQFRDDWRKSRGLILLELIGAKDPIIAWQEIDLTGIEPFTIVFYQAQKLMQWRWDGLAKEAMDLDVSESYIWSSSPLYERPVRENRSRIFSEYVKGRMDSDKLLQFHQLVDNDPLKSIVIDRGFLKTLSITQAVVDGRRVSVSYLDLDSGEETSLSYDLN